LKEQTKSKSGGEEEEDYEKYETDIFLAKGGAEESFQARYSYKGIRYLRVEGFKEKPSPSQFTAKVFNSDMADVGELRSSSELWNKIWEAGRRCIQSNMHLKLYMSTLIKEGESSEKPPLLTKPRKALGDWVHPDGGNIPPEGALIYHNLYFFKYARQMAELAKVIGRAEDEKFYATLAADLKKRFNEHHFDEKDGFYYSTNREPGFRKAVIASYPAPEQIKFAQLDYDSSMGRYRSGWRMTDNGMAYDIVIPPNATALFRLPLLGKKDAIVSEAGKILWQNGKPVGSIDGVSTPAQETDRLVFTLGSGIYSFLVKGN